MQINILLDCQGGCERILKTPIPFVYAAHIKHLLLLYLGTLPIVLVEKLGYSAPIAIAIMTFGLLGIQEAGLEIEDPFGTDPNDLPLDDICSTIARDVLALARP
jgi:putative membrane protein